MHKLYVTGENLLKSDEPVWDETKFTVYGKWMDGWESRRKRTEGYDWCIIKLNIPGDIHSIELDTCHFTGNYSPMASVQACYIDEDSVRCRLILLCLCPIHLLTPPPFSRHILVITPSHTHIHLITLHYII